MTWNPRDSTLKVATLELLVRNGQLRPDEWAVMVGFYPTSSAWSYLKRQYENSYLHRGRDRSGRIVYRIAPKGARYLLWWKKNFPDAKVRP